MFNLFIVFSLQCLLSFGCNRIVKSWFTDNDRNITLTIDENYLDKEIFIIRGVPGIGKKHLVYHMERDFNDNKGFCICDRNNYFIREGKFEFKPKYIHQANQQFRMNFINALDYKSLQRIYVIGYFEEFWMYEEFIKLGELNNYKVRVIELRCPDEEHLTYFNKRGKTSPPLIKSKKCFEVWEHDTDAYIQEPYIEPLEGDCIPKYNKESIIKVDKAFENYLNGECVIESDDEFDKTYEYLCKDNGDHIEVLNEEDIESVLDNIIACNVQRYI